jgi:hypothetical protein
MALAVSIRSDRTCFLSTSAVFKLTLVLLLLEAFTVNYYGTNTLEEMQHFTAMTV